jgi:membrane-bound ClpP family serine protease
MTLLALSVATANADIIFLGLVVSLWIAVTAAYIPGTGIIELIALAGLGLSIAVLVQLPTNWVAVMIIVLGGSIFMLIPFIHVKVAAFALVGLVLQAIGGLSLFNDADMNVSILILALSLLIPAGYHQFILMPMLRNMKKRPTTDRDTHLIGMQGRVTKALDPIGTVYVNSEDWTATTDDEFRVEVGERVVVVARESLRLIVEPIKRKRTTIETELVEEME